MKERDLYPSCRQALLDLLGRVTPLRIRSVEERVKPSSQESPDLLVRTSVGRDDWDLVVECKAVGHPGTARATLLQLRSYLAALSNARHFGIFMAPFISRESARLCEEAGVGYLDLAGNARLAFGSVYIETHAPDNPFRERRMDRPLFTPKAGRVLQVMLAAPLRAWKVTELQQAARVSLGHVSTVRRNLLERGWAEVEDAGLRVTKPEQLLQAWAGAYEPNRVGERKAYTLLHGPGLEEATRSALAEAGAGAHVVYASYSAGRWLAPYVRQATQFFYADAVGAAALERCLHLEPATRGENVVIWEPREDDVFSSRVEPAPGIWCSGPVQTWLDLAASGGRGEEAAEHLLREILAPDWKGRSDE